MDKSSRIYVAGHRGLVGSSICRKLAAEGFQNVITRDRASLDLRRQGDVERFFEQERPEYVFLVAGTVGGILANSTYPADFLRDNLAIQTNVIDASYRQGARKLAFFGSSCIYPRMAPQPIREEYLLTGPLEYTNEWYAIAKIAGIKMAQAYRKQYGFNAISFMPTNLYGPGDHFDLERSHVLPALMRKAHEAKANRAPEFVVWGTGTPLREFLYVDDLADAALFLMLNYNEPEIVNIGSGTEISIRELADLVQRAAGYCGRIVFDSSKPDGTPRKLLDISRIKALGWSPKVALPEGVARTYQWYLRRLECGARREVISTH